MTKIPFLIGASIFLSVPAFAVHLGDIQGRVETLMDRIMEEVK